MGRTDVQVVDRLRANGKREFGLRKGDTITWIGRQDETMRAYYKAMRAKSYMKRMKQRVFGGR